MADLVTILRQAGFRGDALRKAWAISMAESGGRARAHNPDASTGDNSYGLFQINMLGDLGPDRRRRYGLRSNEDLYNPATNARIAYQMSGGGKNWQPWSAFKNGSYEEYLDDFPGVGKSPNNLAPPVESSSTGFQASDDSRRQALLNFVMANNASFAKSGKFDTGPAIGGLLQALKTQTSEAGDVAPAINTQTPSAASGKVADWQKMIEAGEYARKLGLHVGENPYWDPVDAKHTGGSYHYRTFSGNPKVGRGADISGDPAKMMAFAKWFLSRFGGGAELFYDPLGGWDNGKSIGAIGGHGKHVHIAF